MWRNILLLNSQRDHKVLFVKSPVVSLFSFITYSRAEAHLPSIAVFGVLIIAATPHVPMTQFVIESSLCYLTFSIPLLTVSRGLRNNLWSLWKELR